MPSFYEFFAGGGMARMGLGSQWRCEFANDISPMKATAYLQNFAGSDGVFARCDINDLRPNELPGKADLLWGSFPCQDLSLAGIGKGLTGSRSGLIWRLLDVAAGLRLEGRGPKVVVLENVTGLLNSRNGDDFYNILASLSASGYLFGTLTMDAIHFLPQSRPRVFLVAVDTSQVVVSPRLLNGRMNHHYPWTTSRLDKLWAEAPASLRESWIWWNVPAPPARRSTLMDLIETTANGWDSKEYTERLLSLMAPLHLEKINNARQAGREIVGTLYRRTRLSDNVRTQRVEVRFDGVSGCLRTPSGGSSRQRLVFVNGISVRSRLMSTRETARLMGVPDRYRLPTSYNDGYQIAGDGVAVPVVKWLAKHLLLPLCLEPSVKKIETELLYA